MATDRPDHSPRQPNCRFTGGHAVAGGSGDLSSAHHTGRSSARRPGHLFAHRTRPLDPGASCGSDRGPIVADDARRALGRIRVAIAGCLCERGSAGRLGCGCRARGGRGGRGIRAVDAISAAGMATDPDADRGACRTRAGVTAYPGTAAYVGAAGDGGMGGYADPRGGHRTCAAMAAASTHDAVGEPARQLYVWACDDRSDRMRGALVCSPFRTPAGGTAMDAVRRLGAGRRLSQSIRSGNDSRDVSDHRARRRIDDHHRMAAAGFQPASTRSRSSCLPVSATLYTVA